MVTGDVVMDKSWEKAVTNTGIPYYINHFSERTQWDHPEFIKALRMLEDMSSIHLPAYRAAMKLRTLQKLLNLDFVDLSAINWAFDQYGLRRRSEAILDVVQLHNIIYEVYDTIQSRRHSSRFDVTTSTDLLLNWILNLYDMGRTGYVKVLSAKICMVALCASRLTEKYNYFYEQLTDRAGGISRRNMTAFLQDLIRVTELINESEALGRNAGAAVNSCFATVIGTTVSQDRYMSWLMAEPQTIVWLPTMHRLAASEFMKHEVKCNICKMIPIVGLRFKCLKCLTYDMCQDCFFAGMTTKKHKLTHPTEEYVLRTSSRDDLQAFAKTIRNKLSKKHGRRVKLKYLPIDDTDIDPNTYSDPADSKMDMHVRLGRISNKLAAVENMKPQGSPSSIPTTPSPDSGTHPSSASPESGRASAKSKESSIDRSRERRDLEDLIDVLERENEELISDIERLARRRMASADDSDPGEDNDRENDRDGALVDEEDAKGEMMRAKQEVLEEQNRQLELQLGTLKALLKQNRTAPKASASMFVPNHPAPPPPYHAPPTDGFLDQTAPSRLPFHRAVAQLQHSIDVTDNGQARVFMPATHDVTSSRSATDTVAMNDIERLYPPNTIDQSTAFRAVIDGNTLHLPVTLDQSATPQRSHPPQLTNQTMTPGLSDGTVPLLPHHYNQSAMTPGAFASRRLLPAHLTDQSTVMFPNTSASRIFPPEEAEMNEILQRLNEAHPLNVQDEPSSPDVPPLPAYTPAPTFMRTRRPRGERDNPRDMIEAVARIGDAMSTLVARVTDRPSGM